MKDGARKVPERLPLRQEVNVGEAYQDMKNMFTKPSNLPKAASNTDIFRRLYEKGLKVFEIDNQERRLLLLRAYIVLEHYHDPNAWIVTVSN